MLYIKSNKNCIIKQSDTDNLNSIYDKIVKYIWILFPFLFCIIIL